MPQLVEGIIEAEEMEDDLLEEILTEEEPSEIPEAAPASMDRQKLHEEMEVLQHWSARLELECRHQLARDQNFHQRSIPLRRTRA